MDLWYVGGAVFSLIVLSACSGGTQQSSSSASASFRADTSASITQSSPQLITSRVKEYASVSELVQDSSLVVIGTPSGDGTVEEVGRVGVPVPFTVAEFTVQETLVGQEPSQQLTIRQTGTPELRGDEVFLEVGSTYLLFLIENTATEGAAAGYVGQYLPTGDLAGLFLVEGETVRRIDAESPRLPETMALDEARRAILDAAQTG